MPNVNDILVLFQTRGGSQYGGERVTQLEHALQCAALAEDEDAAPELITAALLHDIGHLLHELDDDSPEAGMDDRHEIAGYHFLCGLFPDAVTEPIRLHVPAKRYLCAVDGDYLSQLSQPSIVSLNLQGGPMSIEEVAQFRESRYLDDAVRLRRWDDLAKIPELTTPPLSHFAAGLRHTAYKAAEP